MSGFPVARTHIQYLSSGEQTMIRGVIWRPVQTTPRGVVQLCHGMGGYTGRYDEFARFLASHGFVVCGNDHLGHGMTAIHPDDLGYFAEKDGYAILIEDVYLMTEIMRERLPHAPYFLFGHSMGSLVARLYAEKYGDRLSGLLLSGTSGAGIDNGAALVIARLEQKRKGGRYRSRTLKKLFFSSFLSRIANPKTSADWVTRDEEILKKNKNDPLTGFMFTVSAFIDLLTLRKLCNRRGWAASLPKHLPVYLFSGDMDPVGDYGKGVAQVYESLKAEGLWDVKMKLYGGGRHEMLAEINRQEVYSDILEYLNLHLDPAPHTEK